MQAMREALKVILWSHTQHSRWSWWPSRPELRLRRSCASQQEHIRYPPANKTCFSYDSLWEVWCFPFPYFLYVCIKRSWPPITIAEPTSLCLKKCLPHCRCEQSIVQLTIVSSLARIPSGSPSLALITTFSFCDTFILSIHGTKSVRNFTSVPSPGLYIFPQDPSDL